MTFFIGLLTVVLVLDCVLLILLVLIQLPKKEAGAGLAFGGAATDALFGAGTGNVLTKVTKYATVAFFVLAMGVAMLQSNSHDRNASILAAKIAAQGNQPPALPPASSPAPATTPTAPAAQPTPLLLATNLQSAPAAEPPATPATPAPDAPASAPK